MIGPGTGVRVYLACGVTDMRKGIAGLALLAQDVLHQKPASGAVFGQRHRDQHLWLSLKHSREPRSLGRTPTGSSPNHRDGPDDQ